MNGLVAGFLTICAVQDLRNRAISKWVLIAGALSIAVVNFGVLLFPVFIYGKTTGVLNTALLSRLGGVLVGAVILGLSYCLRGRIGKGDGIVLCITGLGLGFGQNVSMLCFALLFAGLVAAVLLVLHKIRRDGTLPFIPFVLCGFLVTLIG